MRLANKVAIVTGAGAGMGKAVALRFAREGAQVVVAEIHAAGGKATVEAIRRAKGQAIFVTTDVSQENEVKAMVTTTMEQYSRIDILYNNAAVELHGQDARAHELSAEIWDRTHAINLRSVWLCSKYAIPPMLEQHGGSIIHVASPTGLYGCAPGYTAYSASKGGVVALARVMAADYARDAVPLVGCWLLAGGAFDLYKRPRAPALLATWLVGVTAGVLLRGLSGFRRVCLLHRWNLHGRRWINGCLDTPGRARLPPSLCLMGRKNMGRKTHGSLGQDHFAFTAR